MVELDFKMIIEGTQKYLERKLAAREGTGKKLSSVSFACFVGQWNPGLEKGRHNLQRALQILLLRVTLFLKPIFIVWKAGRAWPWESIQIAFPETSRYLKPANKRTLENEN